MKILLDENMPLKVKYDFGEGFEIHTVKDMNWLGKKNGELIGLAAFNGFDVLITLDRNLKHQQNLHKVEIKFIVLLVKDNKSETVQPYVEKIRAFLQSSSNIPKLTEIALD